MSRSNLIKIHAADGAILSNAYGSVLITHKVVGQLYLPSGEIVMGDPLVHYAMVDFERKAFAIKVEPGTYPLTAYTAEKGEDRTLAFAELQFSNKQPTNFVSAKTIFDTVHQRKGFCGYPVHDSRTGLMDTEVFRSLCNLPRFTSVEKVISFDNLCGDARAYYDQHCTVGSSRDGALSAAIFAVNSGIYYWYWGKDRAGQLCCLIADFFTYH